MAFFITRGDTSPSLPRTLRDRVGRPVNLTGATVLLRISRGGSCILEVEATLVDPAAGSVIYNWQPGDTDVAGKYDFRWKATYADGTVETFPNVAPETLLISPDC